MKPVLTSCASISFSLFHFILSIYTSSGGSGSGVCPRLHFGLSRRVRHFGRGARRAPLGGAETAHRHCASPAGGPARALAGRSNFRAGRRVGAPGKRESDRLKYEARLLLPS